MNLTDSIEALHAVTNEAAGKRVNWATVATGLGVAGLGLGLGYYVLSTREQPPFFDTSLPTASELSDKSSELEGNWGQTPENLRAGFLLMEEASRITGLARLAAVVAYMESGWNTGYRDDSSIAVLESKVNYYDHAGSLARLKFAKQAQNFGKGGLFGLYGPEFLWAGANDRHSPLTELRPEVMLSHPRASLFAASYYMAQLLRRYVVESLTEFLIGWTNGALLTAEGIKSGTYQQVRARVELSAKEAGIDLNDTDTMPTLLSASAWPGSRTVARRILRGE